MVWDVSAPGGGGGGGGGGGKVVFDASGQVDGITDTFSIFPAAFVPGSVEVLRNGLHEQVSTFTELPPNAVKLSVVPDVVPSPEWIEIRYTPA